MKNAGVILLNISLAFIAFGGQAQAQSESTVTHTGSFELAGSELEGPCSGASNLQSCLAGEIELAAQEKATEQACTDNGNIDEVTLDQTTWTDTTTISGGSIFDGTYVVDYTSSVVFTTGPKLHNRPLCP